MQLRFALNKHFLYLLNVHQLGLVHLSDCDMMLGCDGESSLKTERRRLYKTDCRLNISFSTHQAFPSEHLHALLISCALDTDSGSYLRKFMIFFLDFERGRNALLSVIKCSVKLLFGSFCNSLQVDC